MTGRMEELSDRFRWKVLTQLLPQKEGSLHRAPGRTALPSTASDWLLISIFTPSFNSLKKSQVEGRHFHTFLFQEFPKYFFISLVHHPGVGLGFSARCHCSVTSQLREDCWLTALLLWFPPFINISADNPKSTPKSSSII